MSQKSGHPTSPSERIVRDIRRATRKHLAAEDKVRIVLDGFRGESSIAELCRREGITESLYYTWLKEFLGAGLQKPPGGKMQWQVTFRVLLSVAKVAAKLRLQYRKRNI